MKTLVMLYMLYLELGGAGKGKVTILQLSRYMRLSKTQMKNDLQKVNELGYINVYEQFGKNNYRVYKVSISNDGQQYLEDNWDAAQAEYHKHVAETIALINERNSAKYSSDKRISKKTASQIIAGQKELF